MPGRVVRSNGGRMSSGGLNKDPPELLAPGLQLTCAPYLIGSCGSHRPRSLCRCSVAPTLSGVLGRGRARRCFVQGGKGRLLGCEASLWMFLYDPMHSWTSIWSLFRGSERAFRRKNMEMSGKMGLAGFVPERERKTAANQRTSAGNVRKLAD